MLSVVTAVVKLEKRWMWICLRTINLAVFLGLGEWQKSVNERPGGMVMRCCVELCCKQVIPSMVSFYSSLQLVRKLFNSRATEQSCLSEVSDTLLLGLLLYLALVTM